jgi:hypothetical protein
MNKIKGILNCSVFLMVCALNAFASNGLVNLTSDLSGNPGSAHVHKHNNVDYLMWIQNGRLYSYNTDNQNRVELTASLSSPSVFSTYGRDWLVEGSSVVFMSGSDLYAVPLAGGSAVKLNGPNYVIRPFYLDSASSTVYFHESSIGLNRIAVTGGMPTLLVANDTTAIFGGSPQLTPDRSKIVFSGYQRSDSQNIGLYAINVNGGTPIRLNNPNQPTSESSSSGFGLRGITRFEVSNSRVVYIADDLVDGENHLFSAPLSGSGPTILVNQIPNQTSIQSFEITPDGNRVVFSENSFNGLFFAYYVTLFLSVVADELAIFRQVAI